MSLGNHHTGVVFNPGRMQPYTVWVNGRTVYFTDSRTEAEARLGEYKRFIQGGRA